MAPASPIHLHPTAPLAERVILPGDPGRALLLAQELLAEPKMFNHSRGLWGYTGAAADGEPMTIQSTGMGGPSAAIVVEELIALGARRLVRAGTCGAIGPALELGDLVVAGEALAGDGASRALGAPDRVAADPALTAALVDAAGVPAGLIATTDLFYEPERAREDAWAEAGAVAVEMEAATIFQVAARHGAAAGCVLAVSDLVGRHARIGKDELSAAGARVGRAAAAALGG